MNQKLQKLRLLRDDETQTKEELNKLMNEIPAFKALEEIREKKVILESEIRNEVIEKFKETGEKKFGQLGIRISKVPIYEPEQAMTWAESNMPIAIKKVLDKKQFETFAKINNLDFVTIDEVPTATIPSEIKLE